MNPIPHSGFRRHSQNRKFEEVIVFIHHFGGSPINLSRHHQMASDLGFDSVSFQLRYNKLTLWQRPPISSSNKWGIREVWEEQITEVLDSLKEPKILFSFSSPSSATLMSINRRMHIDIKGWICDGGPFFQLWKCFWNYFGPELGITSPIVRAAYSAFAIQLLGGKNKYESECSLFLDSLPNQFPILSIRSWNDQLIPLSAIDDFFKGHDHLDLEILSIPDVGHLQGLSHSPKVYIPRVKNFLNKISTPKAH